MCRNTTKAITRVHQPDGWPQSHCIVAAVAKYFVTSSP